MYRLIALGFTSTLLTGTIGKIFQQGGTLILTDAYTKHILHYLGSTQEWYVSADNYDKVNQFYFYYNICKTKT